MHLQGEKYPDAIKHNIGPSRSLLHNHLGIRSQHFAIIKDLGSVWCVRLRSTWRGIWKILDQSFANITGSVALHMQKHVIIPHRKVSRFRTVKHNHNEAKLKDIFISSKCWHQPISDRISYQEKTRMSMRLAAVSCAKCCILQLQRVSERLDLNTIRIQYLLSADTE